MMQCSCEEKKGRMVGVEEEGWIRIWQEMIAGRGVWGRMWRQCGWKGWGQVEFRSERVVGRRGHFGKEVKGMRLASVRMEGEGEQWVVEVVEVLDHVEGALL